MGRPAHRAAHSRRVLGEGTESSAIPTLFILLQRDLGADGMSLGGIFLASTYSAFVAQNLTIAAWTSPILQRESSRKSCQFSISSGWLAEGI